MKFIIFVLFLLPLSSWAQNYSEVDQGTVSEEIADSFEAAAQEVSTSEIETSLHPEGESSDWSLGSEELPVENF